ncbi:hypothetical protein AOC36_10285 [Erysipelothrix larvae]|uniref:HpcH/HpaI aldolase/citrate lyase domain-containing protein n=1 Tax=Erysipelothrix larvae TaxID=1514105 RepID=A0A0X8H1H0_9FIRM|nr:aldolase/citrate lyase family protein [Erysipelothrix larvae]AMC94345.1 hypothetical protein AOC36_10285 [Erysipelothrix larvae]
MNKKHGILVKIVDTFALPRMMKDNGFDLIFYDLEHGVLSQSRMHDLIMYGNAIGLDSWVRVCEGTKSEIARIADCGASGIMVPMIESKEQAQNLVDYCKYGPIGKRSYAGGANTQYGPSGSHQNNMNEINKKMNVIIQIESQKGVDNVDEILSVPGIDVVIVGPVDLGISMGLVDQKEHPDLLKAIKKVSDASKKYGHQFGIIGTPSLCEIFKKELDVVVDYNDLSLIRDGLVRSHQNYIERINNDE